MKVTVEVDCTPAEAKGCMGLPDLRRMHMAMGNKLEEQMTVSFDGLSPDPVSQDWFGFNPKTSNSRRVRQFHHGRDNQG